MSDYTKGPWTWAVGFCELGAADESVVIGADDEFNVTVNNPADASLISAAPEMYEALKAALDVLRAEDDDDEGDYPDWSNLRRKKIVVIEAALRKAEGKE